MTPEGIAAWWGAGLASLLAVRELWRARPRVHVVPVVAEQPPPYPGQAWTCTTLARTTNRGTVPVHLAAFEYQGGASGPPVRVEYDKPVRLDPGERRDLALVRTKGRADLARAHVEGTDGKRWKAGRTAIRRANREAAEVLARPLREQPT